MTFILTELSDEGIFMAADSSETIIEQDGLDFQENNKVVYFPDFNIGISTWGDSVVEGEDINLWLNEELEKFKADYPSEEVENECLEDIADYLSKRLNEVLPEGKVLGLHVAGYSYSPDMEDLRPGLYHIHNHNHDDKKEIYNCLAGKHRKGDGTQFVAERTKPALLKGEVYHVRNGMYKEFSVFFQPFKQLRDEFREKIKSNHDGLIKDTTDIVKTRAESVANWVRLMCTIFTEAGLYPVVGKDIRVLAILPDDYREFTLREFKED